MRRRLTWVVLAGILVLVVCLALVRTWVVRATSRWIHGVPDAPTAELAIVLGAGVRADGTPSPVLAARVEAGVELLRRGAVQRLLMSGADGEPQAMRRHAVALGAPPDAILIDAGGTRTFETCRRARARFGVSRALVVTQAFHLPRALFLCSSLGIDASGVVAADPGATGLVRAGRALRETIATSVAMAESTVARWGEETCR